MTAWPARSAVITAAVRERGTVEHPANSNRQKYGAALGMNGVRWCGIFVWYAFHVCGIDLRKVGIPHPEYTPAFATTAKAASWREVRTRDMQPGDVVFYDFPDSHPGIQHVEFALSGLTRDGSFSAVGGNTSSGDGGSQSNGGGVFVRTRHAHDVVRVLRPPYGPERARPSLLKRISRALQRKPKRPPLLVYRLGERDTARTRGSVRAVQAMLNRKLSGPDLKVDGVYGPRTENAVRRFQLAHHLTVDGEAGPRTLQALWS